MKRFMPVEQWVFGPGTPITESAKNILDLLLEAYALISQARQWGLESIGPGESRHAALSGRNQFVDADPPIVAPDGKHPIDQYRVTRLGLCDGTKLDRWHAPSTPWYLREVMRSMLWEMG